MPQPFLTDADQALVHRVRLAHVATTDPQGKPHVSPKGTFWAVDERHAAFIHIHSERTVSNLAHQPWVAATVVDIFERRGLLITGAGRVVTAAADQSEYERLCQSYRTRRGALPQNPHAVVLIESVMVEHVWSPAYDNGASVAQVEEKWRAFYCPTAKDAATKPDRQDQKVDNPGLGERF